MGRPKGSPNKATVAVKAIASQYTAEVIRTLVRILHDDQAPAAARVAAGKELLDRGHGRPAQAVDVGVQGTLAVRVVHEHIAD